MSETRAQYGEAGAPGQVQHTPGPWIILEYDESWDSLEITSTDRMERLKSEIANIPAGFDGDIGAEQQANARLVAAAPDLLKELRRMVETCEACDDIAPHLKGHIASARAVVAKATGSPGGESQPPAEPRELLCMLCSTEYAPWFAPNALWNAAVRRPDGTDEVPFLCPTCFTKRAVAAGINQVFVLSTETEPHEREAELVHEVERLREALREIAEGHDVGRHDGLPEPCPALDAETMFAMARAALNHAAPAAEQGKHG